MRRMNLVLVLLLVVGVALLGVVTPVVAAQKGAAGGGPPKPDGRFQVTTTSIAQNVGVSWADGRFSFNNQDYKFRVEARTDIEADVMGQLMGKQISYEGNLYNLKNVQDFAGTYTRVKPDVVKAMGGTGKNPVFQNEKGVVLVLTKRTQSAYDLDLRLMGDSFKVTLAGF